MLKRTSILTPLLALASAACVGTPRLLKPIDQATARPSPSIDDVKSEITCELVKFRREQFATKGLDGYFQGSYLITATLTLQADDYQDITPTLNFIQPIAAATGTRTEIASADLGGQRERTYTEIFYIDSSKLKIDDASFATACEGERLRADRYSLTGDLKLAEIVENGERSLRSTQAIAPTRTSNTNPSFGSTVEFIVTKSVSALGIQWALVHFKGPSGSNGLVNGKKVTTDKLILAFTQTLPASLSDSSKLTDAIVHLATAVQAAAAAAREEKARIFAKAAADARVETLEQPFRSLLRNRPGARPGPALTEARQSALSEATALQAAQSASAATARSVEDAKLAVTAITSATSERNAVDSAAFANQQLQTTMILQSLNIQPR